MLEKRLLLFASQKNNDKRQAQILMRHREFQCAKDLNEYKHYFSKRGFKSPKPKGHRLIQSHAQACELTVSLIKMTNHLINLEGNSFIIEKQM